MAKCQAEYCDKPSVEKGESSYPYCSHDCGISDYYHRKDREHRAQFEAWEKLDPDTRGPFRSTVFFD